MIFPNKLKSGDTVGLVAPSFPIAPDKIPLCKEKLESLGYQVKMGKALEEALNFHNYLAGDAAVRAADINRMFGDDEVKAIFCARGGYGSSHIMRYLDFELMKKNPKIFVGFSDITNIHAALQMFCNLVSFHGPMVFSNMLEKYDDYTKGSLEAAINMEEELEFKNPPGEEGFKTIRGGRAEGILVGGNLSLIARGSGTFYQLDTKDRILFLEEVEETLPSIDMLVTQMEYAGLFDGIKGLLLGDFTKCDNDRYDGTYQLEEFLADRFGVFNVPIMYHIRSGHDQPMGTLPLGAVCKMDADEKHLHFYR